MKLKDMPLAHRPQEKLVSRGPNGVDEAELLAILLKTGYRGHDVLDMSRRILRTHSLAELLALPLEKLAEIKGLGRSRAALLKAVASIAERVHSVPNLPSLSSPEEIVQVTHHLAGLQQEHFVALFLNARYQLLMIQAITIGTLNASLVHAREVFAPAIAQRAAFVILVHNHPSGNPEPSADDVEVTEQMVEIGQLLDIPVLDHVIVAKDGWRSLKQLKLL